MRGFSGSCSVNFQKADTINRIFSQYLLPPIFLVWKPNMLFVEQLFCVCETVWKVFLEFITIILTKQGNRKDIASQYNDIAQ